LNCSVFDGALFKCDQSQQNSCPNVLQCHKSLIWEGCYKCDSMESGAKCLTCNSGYKSDKSGNCISCSSDECCPENIVNPITSHCAVCDSDYKSCRTCEEGYSNSGGVCKVSNKGMGMSTGTIVGIVVGGVLVVVILFFTIIPFVILLRRRVKANHSYLDIVDDAL